MEEMIHAKVFVLVPGLCPTTFRTVRDPGIGHCFLGGKAKANLTGSSCSEVVLTGTRGCPSKGFRFTGKHRFLHPSPPPEFVI